MDDLAMTLLAPGRPLAAVRRVAPAPGAGEVLLEVSACGVCRTDLHIVDGELPPARTPLVSRAWTSSLFTSPARTIRTTSAVRASVTRKPAW